MFLKFFMNNTHSKIFLIIFLIFNILNSKELYSKISNKNLSLNQLPNSYSFVIGGHTYGTPSPSLYPAASLLYKVREFNEMDLKFMILLGDIIQHQGSKNGIGELEIKIFKKTVSDMLDIPIFNSPGNHDVRNRDLYKKYFGDTYFHFQNSSELFIILDTELKSGQIEGSQLEYVLDLIKSTSKNINIKNIFIFMHKTLWAVNNTPLNTIDPWVNGPRKGKPNEFEQIILPTLISISENKNIYIMSGDIGIKDYKLGKFPQESFPLFYFKDSNTKITYIGCGLAENENDAFIKVDVTRDGEVSFSIISLLGKDLGDINQYGIDYWKKYFPEKVKNKEPDIKLNNKDIRSKQKLFPLITNVIKNKYFILGNIFSFTIIFFGFMLLRYFLKDNK